MNMAVNRKTQFLLPLLVVMLSAAAYAEEFRENNWGDSRAQVIQREGEPIKNEGEWLSFRVKTDGQDALLGLRFLEDQLTNAIYDFRDPEASSLETYQQFFKIEKMLEDKYGAYEKLEATMPTNIPEGDAGFNQVADFIASGRGSLVEIWETPSTTIVHSLNGSDGVMRHSVTYSSKRHSALQEKYRKDEEANEK